MCGKPARAREETKNNNNNKTKRVMHDTKTPCHAAKNINEAKKKKKKKRLQGSDSLVRPHGPVLSLGLTKLEFYRMMQDGPQA